MISCLQAPGVASVDCTNIEVITSVGLVITFPSKQDPIVQISPSSGQGMPRQIKPKLKGKAWVGWLNEKKL
jgi:hypothetical protein